MIDITSRLDAASDDSEAADTLELPFELRQKSRLRARLASGEEMNLNLPRGEILRGGDVLVASDGRIVRVVARHEPLLHVECDSPSELARAAYHLGNRHVAVQVGDGWLRLVADHVLERMLQGLGARVSMLEAPFEPEAGAYSGHAHGAHHHHPGSGARIHEYASHTHGQGDR